jgi:hypothetical protein
MMEHFYLSVGIFVISLMVAAIVVSSGMKLVKKLMILCLLLLAGTSTYRMFDNFYGYPTQLKQDLQDTKVHGFLVDKPNQVIYLWIQAPGEEPRSYTVPFDHKLAKYLDQKRRQNRGRPFKMNLRIRTDHTNPYGTIIEEVRPGGSRKFPPKEQPRIMPLDP